LVDTIGRCYRSPACAYSSLVPDCNVSVGAFNPDPTYAVTNNGITITTFRKHYGKMHILSV